MGQTRARYAAELRRHRVERVRAGRSLHEPPREFEPFRRALGSRGWRVRAWLLLVLFAGMVGDAPAGAMASPKASRDAGGALVPETALDVTDDMGVEVRLKAPPRRIVSLAPSNTELLFALGLGDRVVGVTDFCNFPPRARALPHVAGFNTVNVEMIVAARPDLVLASRGNDREALKSLRSLGVPVFALDVQTLDGLVAAVQRVGRLCGAAQRGDSVAAGLARRIARVRARVDTVSHRPRVMWGYWSEPVYTAGKHTMIDDVLTSAGGENVGRRARGAWPQVGLETIVAWAPEVIITTYHGDGSGPGDLAGDVERLRHTEGWKEIPAVQQGRVYYVDADLLNRPGPRLVDALEIVARLLHPALFAPEPGTR